MTRILRALLLAAAAGSSLAAASDDQSPAPAQPESTPAPAAAPAPPAVTLQPLSTIRPSIPDDACRQRLSGWVSVEFAVMPEGTVAEIRVTGSEPKDVFDASAIQAIAGRTYTPQAKPIKLRERLAMTFADCRSEQLRSATVPDGAAPSQADCPALAAAARTAGDPIDHAESGRAVLSGDGAQVYLAPADQCYAKGRTLKSGSRLVARVEYKGFSLVNGAKSGEEFWIRSNQLKDTAP